MARAGRGTNPWTRVAVVTVIISGLVASCSNTTQPQSTTQSPTTSGSTAGTGTTPTTSQIDTPAAELRVPTDLINKTVDDASAQLSAAGIQFTTSFEEAEDSQVGRVMEVDPVGGTVLSRGDSVRLLVGKPKETPPPTPIRAGDLSITEIKFDRVPGSPNCDMTVTVFNNLQVNAEGINVVGHLQMRDQNSTRITLDFSRRIGLQTLEAQAHHQFHGDVTFALGVTASYQIKVVQGDTVIYEVSEQVATCA